MIVQARCPRGTCLADAEGSFIQGSSMALRTIKTPDGAEWAVWNVEPSLGAAYGTHAQLSTALTGGWLAFQSGHERRRVTPVPEDWEQLPDADLAALWNIAEPIRDGGHLI